MKSVSWKEVLKTACRLSGATWAARLFYDEQAWHVEAVWGLRARAAARLSAEVDAAWLNGALSSGRVRSRRRGEARWYVFPELHSQTVYLVAAPQALSADGRQVWRLMLQTQMAVQQDPAALGVLFGTSQPQEVPLLAPHEMENALAHVLDLFLRVARAEGGWLGVFSGNELTIAAATRPALQGRRALIDLGRWQDGRPRLFSAAEAEDAPFVREAEQGQFFALTPVLNGRRPLAAVLLWRQQPFTPRERLSLQVLARYTSLTIESLVTLAELSVHARRLGLLNDFIRTVSVASTLEKSVERVFNMLQRTFGTRLISLALFSADETQLRLYRLQEGKVHMQVQDADKSPLARVIRNGRLMRYARLGEAPAAPRLNNEARSLLWSPLRHGGQPIGAIVLENTLPQAFSSADENLLAGIASHLSGVVEYGRLLEHAEAHAHNLEALHLLVRQLIGQTDLNAVVQVTAEMLARTFGYDCVWVSLQNETGRLFTAYAGGKAAAACPPDLEHGPAAEAWREKRSLLLNDLPLQPGAAAAAWTARSLLSAPVLLDDQVVGGVHIESRRQNAFSQSDLLALEALAGVLGNVTALAWQYQRLADTIHHLEEARQELQARVHAQQLAETRLLQAAKLAAVGEMAAGVAHELNNPLTTVIGFTELALNEPQLPVAVREDLSLVLKEAKRARDVVRRLLDFSRQSETAFLRADLNAVIEDVLALMAHLMHSRGVHLQRNLHPELPWVVIDRDRMKQVFLNLLHNALNAMPDGGQITITTAVAERSMENWVRVDVEDTGLGIEPELLDRIFEPFFTTRSEQGGTGLGLSVTYGIISDHKGTIEVASQPGQGTRFSIWLPLPQEETL